MKCDKLKDYSILDIEAIDDERYKTESAPGKLVPESRVYLKSEVDAAFDELRHFLRLSEENIDRMNNKLRLKIGEFEELKAENEDTDYQRKQLSRLCAIKENEIKELIDKIQDLKVIVSQKEDAINELVDKAFNIKKERDLAQRALWLMTAEWAEAMGLASCNIANKFMSQESFEVGDDYRQKTIKKYRHRQVVFLQICGLLQKESGGSIKIELTKDEVDTLLKVLDDYKEVLLKRIAKESKNGSFSNANGKRSFIYKFIIPLKVKLIDMTEGV